MAVCDPCPVRSEHHDRHARHEPPAGHQKEQTRDDTPTACNNNARTRTRAVAQHEPPTSHPHAAHDPDDPDATTRPDPMTDPRTTCPASRGDDPPAAAKPRHRPGNGPRPPRAPTRAQPGPVPAHTPRTTCPRKPRRRPTSRGGQPNPAPMTDPRTTDPASATRDPASDGPRMSRTPQPDVRPDGPQRTPRSGPDEPRPACD